MAKEDRIQVNVCMGSSCFARGNRQFLEKLREALQREGLPEAIDISGSLCQGRCESGPNLELNGKTHSDLTERWIQAILKELS